MKTPQQLETIARDTVYRLLTNQSTDDLLELLVEEESKIVFDIIKTKLDEYEDKLNLAGFML